MGPEVIIDKLVTGDKLIASRQLQSPTRILEIPRSLGRLNILWSLGRRMSESMIMILWPDWAMAIAKLAQVIVFPSLAPALVMSNERGEWPGVEKRMPVLTPR
jgi:hypothetical protein